MRRIILLLAGVGVALGLFTAWTNIAPNADTPVVVLAAGDVILHLPIGPDMERITTELSIELNAAAAGAGDDRIADAFRSWSRDDALLRQVASAPAEMFDSGAAAATATAVYDIRLSREAVTVIVTTVELVPGYGSTATSRDHEDGHALINREITKRCASAVFLASLEDGRYGESLINNMLGLLGEANAPVHATYHSYARAARYGQHLGFAERALDDVVGCT